ncbi:pyridoxamine 5'-phosphate oxidase family protein [Variovorax guangxiensis]|uniref:Pyridoxamine 5'-phosphate oxidase n=1 Tax=Variovorax guangxiensis TaxID=1775474 RepID=A0A502E063_9BURK|nr:pyridoxamine 5'-phosphate oxidase family protein [Variovorax guangxiensis]RZI65047.1 MAG: pyridoxamine 5'-phosphate oxidase [Variovorax sp.]TPG27251.1 pyridoxamine 5'-phosphate oxidase [Variovorax ginsengisoli]TPG30977.1 pyridoxamine 5'-phosphate oxidase [Variovorax guangxiensis]
MSNSSLESIARKMRHLDIATFTTVTDDGALGSRPMSNNGDVEYDGNSYYFTLDSARMVSDIRRNPKVSLGFEGLDGLHIAVTGQAEVIQDKAAFEAHWVPDLDNWFDHGVDTPGLALLKVKAARVKYWQGEDSGEWVA